MDCCRPLVQKGGHLVESNRFHCMVRCNQRYRSDRDLRSSLP
ncbi:hypothetical protein AB395_00003262 [Sinorhizobium fredii CCBAU 45436]|nr:hypothetical protein AB395_00003262 [Sinorhizobium fredii CCBAU 45436]AWM26611.1 hypothetical protein AOX55_00003373 [Sinorhizobium fredii CCBAU 25509]